MRKARITWVGSLHHVMNHSINKENIFKSSEMKNIFLDLLKEKAKIFRIDIYAYCVMSNHFHLVLKNSTGRMSDFLKQLNGHFAVIYRKKSGGRGYVFQNRYKSTLIQNESYLIASILYTLLNPVRAKLVMKYDEYPWSSANEYFKQGGSEIIDTDFINGLFGNKQGLSEHITIFQGKELPVYDSKFGKILGEKNFLSVAQSKFDRRKIPDPAGIKRIDEKYFEPVEKVIHEFEKKHGIKIDNIEACNFSGKRFRGELLVLLKDLAGLKYREIKEFPIFSDIQYNSMGNLYRNTKKRLKDSNKYKF